MPKAMPKTAQTATSKPRTAPYPKASPSSKDNDNKENDNPRTASKNSNVDWRSIELESKRDEVPCYDNAATVRRKLNKLLTDKSKIPGSTKNWNKAAMAKEMMDLEQRDGAPERANKNGKGPSARSLTSFMKKTGNMGGGDSDAYYFGNILLEKLRIYHGEPKSKTRLESEKA